MRKYEYTEQLPLLGQVFTVHVRAHVRCTYARDVRRTHESTSCMCAGRSTLYVVLDES